MTIPNYTTRPHHSYGKISCSTTKVPPSCVTSAPAVLALGYLPLFASMCLGPYITYPILQLVLPLCFFDKDSSGTVFLRTPKLGPVPVLHANRRKYIVTPSLESPPFPFLSADSHIYTSMLWVPCLRQKTSSTSSRSSIAPHVGLRQSL